MSKLFVRNPYTVPVVKFSYTTRGIKRDAALKVVEKFMEVVKDSLASGENVYLRVFGTFLTKERAEKTVSTPHDPIVRCRSIYNQNMDHN